MSANTSIEWADHTFNPWEGCQNVGPGCDHCYAETRNARFGGGTAPNWGPGAPRRRTSPANWQQPRRWNREAAAAGKRPRVFCASLADVFDNAVPEAWRRDLFALIGETPHLDWLLLTKRIGNAIDMLPTRSLAEPWPNVWLGATIVNQAEADRDIPKLLATPTAMRFLSMEPLLGPVDVRRWLHDEGCPATSTFCICSDPREEHVEWVIAGGESGPGARPSHPEWYRSLRDQCANAEVPFLFKQWGEWVPLRENGGGTWATDAGGCCRLNVAGERADDGWPMQRVGKKFAGRFLDGVEHGGFPA